MIVSIMSHRHKTIILSVFLIAAIVSCWLLISWIQEAGKFSPDSCYYLRVAQNISEGKLYVDHRAKIDKYLTAPFYPIAVKFASFFISDLEAAAVWVNKVAAALLIIVVFLWGRRAFGDWSGVIAAGVTASAIVTISADILTESLFTLMFVASAWAIWESSRNPRILYCVLAGALMGLATLTREIGVAMIPLGAGWIFLMVLLRNGRSGLIEGLSRGAVYGACAVATIAPYWVYSLAARGTWWGSRFSEREVRVTGESVSVIETTALSVPRAVSAMWRHFPEAVGISIIIGLVIPLTAKVFKYEKPVGGKDWSLVFILVFFVANVLAIGLLGVYAPHHWQRYLLPTTPILVLIAAQGVEGAAVLVSGFISKHNLKARVVAKHTLAGAAMAGLIFVSIGSVISTGKKYNTPAYQASLFSAGMEKVARDFTDEYDVLPETYVYDRKPFFAYYIGATWAGLPEDIALTGLAEVGKERPVILVINNAIIFSYPYKQLRWLLVPDELPEKWHLLSTHFLPEYGRTGRLVSLYTYGDYYPAFSVKPDEHTYDEHLERARMWAAENRYYRALKHCEAAISLNNERAEAYLFKARIIGAEGAAAYAPGVLADAMDLVKRAMALEPDNEEARDLLCRISKAKSNLDGSKPICPRGAGSVYEKYLQKARRLMGQGQLKQAMQQCEKAIRVDNSRPEGYLLKAQMLHTAGEMSHNTEELAEAVELVKHVLASDSDNEKAKGLLCKITTSKSQMDGSRPICPR